MLQSLAASQGYPVYSVLSLLDQCNAIPDHVDPVDTEMDLRSLENGWLQRVRDSKVDSPDFQIPTDDLDVVSDRKGLIYPDQARRFTALGELTRYLNIWMGSDFSNGLITGAFSSLHPSFVMTLLADHLLSLTGHRGDIFAAMTPHRGLQLCATDIEHLLYSANVSTPNGYRGWQILLSPVRLWHELGELTHTSQVVPLDNSLFVAQALYHLSIDRSYDDENGLYTGDALAFSFVEAALAIYPEHAPFLYQRGKLEGSDPDLALNHLRGAIGLMPDYWDAWEGAGNVYEFQGMLEEARNCWERVAELLQRVREVEERTGIPTNALPPNETAAPFHFKIGVLCEAMGDRNRALHYYARAHEMSYGAMVIPQDMMPAPENTESSALILLRMGKIFLREGHEEEAKARLGKAVELDPALSELAGI